LEHIARAGFTAVQSEVPPTMTAEAYGKLLAKYGLHPGPGYVSLPWSDDADERSANLERASALAYNNVALGNPLLFLATGMGREAPRVARPAVGHDASPERLSLVRDYLASAAERIVAEGGVAALHPHVGTWIETADEARFVLDSVDPARTAWQAFTSRTSAQTSPAKAAKKAGTTASPPARESGRNWARATWTSRPS
jgi:inosose dehydratase